MATKKRYIHFFSYCNFTYFSFLNFFSFNWSAMVFFNSKSNSNWCRFLIWLNVEPYTASGYSHITAAICRARRERRGERVPSPTRSSKKPSSRTNRTSRTSRMSRMSRTNRTKASEEERRAKAHFEHEANEEESSAKAYSTGETNEAYSTGDKRQERRGVPRQDLQGDEWERAGRLRVINWRYYK